MNNVRLIVKHFVDYEKFNEQKVNKTDSGE